MLEWSIAIVKQYNIWITCFLEKVLDCLSHMFNFSISLWMMKATCEVYKAKNIREIQELFEYGLRAFIANDNFRNTILSEY